MSSISGPAVASVSQMSRYAQANGLDFHYLEQGRGEPILFLHGFPDHAATWRPLAERLSPEFRLIAPDLRGYGLTSRPLEIESYRLEHLIDDVAALIDALDLPMMHLCGHDWGGVLAFAFAEKHPHKAASLTVFNAPPPSVLQSMIWNDPSQRLASQYITMLRSVEADALFNEANVDALIERFLGQPYRQGLLNDADIEAYRHAWTRNGVWQAMLAWYRAAPFDVPDIDAEFGKDVLSEFHIECPVQIIWGDQDTVFVPAMADAIAHACPEAILMRLPAAGHVPHRDAPEHCAALITKFLAQHPIRLISKEVTA
jgi:pimeloyl-ACP methyl ester carboxylesterase